MSDTIYIVLKKNRIIKAYYNFKEADKMYQFSKQLSDGMTLQSVAVE